MSSPPKAGVVGWPIIHSLSPALHAFWRDVYGRDGTYTRVSVRPEMDFEQSVRQLIKSGYKGVNVTLPYKAAAAALADDPSDTVKQLGVANMLTFQGGRIAAENTDVSGFRAALEEKLRPDSPREKALVLGAGGAAPAICHALKELGYGSIVIANRTRDRATALAKAVGPCASAVDWVRLEEHLGDCGLLVNTTSLGMEGQPPLRINTDELQASAIVADIVYTPLQTRLLEEAAERGLQTINGLSMLMYQAVPGFEKWLGISPDVTEGLEQHLVRILNQRGKGPVKIGLTGSIGMGKTTIGQILVRLGAALWDADGAVHRLYAKGGGAAGPVGEVFPSAIEEGAVSREKLAAHLMNNPQDFKTLEAIVHPLVDADRQAFMRRAREEGAEAIVLDIPLLFETGQSHAYDVIMVVTADEEVRKARVLKRPGMTEEKYAAIVARQMPEEEKRLLADHLILTDKELDETAADVVQAYHDILEKYAGGLA